MSGKTDAVASRVQSAVTMKGVILMILLVITITNIVNIYFEYIILLMVIII